MKENRSIDGADHPLSREEKAWEMAKAYAKEKAALLYPDQDRRTREESRIAHAEYLRLMYP